MNFTALIVPVIVGSIIFIALVKKVDIFGEFIDGAKESLKSGIEILPSLIILMSVVGMFKVSGGLDLISYALRSLTDLIGFPEQCVPLALIRPISGSGALAVYEGLLNECSPDSFAGRVASVLMGSTETTFYTIAVYYSVTKVKKTSHTVVASLSADIAGFIASVVTVALVFGIV